MKTITILEEQFSNLDLIREVIHTVLYEKDVTIADLVYVYKKEDSELADKIKAWVDIMRKRTVNPIDLKDEPAPVQKVLLAYGEIKSVLTRVGNGNVEIRYLEPQEGSKTEIQLSVD